MTWVDYEKEDWQQQSFIILKKAVETFNPAYEVSFSGYFRMLLYRWGRGKLEQPKTEQCSFDDAVNWEQEAESIYIEEAYETLEKNLEQAAYVKDLLTILDEKESHIIEAYYFKGQAIGEVAHTMGTTYDAIECKKRRILKKLFKKATESEKAPIYI